jgi:hypothetical protein
MDDMREWLDKDREELKRDLDQLPIDPEHIDRALNDPEKRSAMASVLGRVLAYLREMWPELTRDDMEELKDTLAEDIEDTSGGHEAHAELLALADAIRALPDDHTGLRALGQVWHTRDVEGGRPPFSMEPLAIEATQDFITEYGFDGAEKNVEVFLAGLTETIARAEPDAAKDRYEHRFVICDPEELKDAWDRATPGTQARFLSLIGARRR